MSPQEKRTAIILALCLLLWVLEKQSGISSATTAVIGGALLFATGVLNTEDLRTRLDWGLILFIGSVFCLGVQFSDIGISTWIVSVLAPVLEHIHSTMALIVVLFLLVYILRLFIISQTVVIGLMLGVMMPLFESMGMHPFLTGVMIYMAVDVWFVLYQNTTYLAAYGMMEGTVVPKEAAKCSWFYAAAAPLASLLSLPYWHWLGYIQ